MELTKFVQFYLKICILLSNWFLKKWYVIAMIWNVLLLYTECEHHILFHFSWLPVQCGLALENFLCNQNDTCSYVSTDTSRTCCNYWIVNYQRRLMADNLIIIGLMKDNANSSKRRHTRMAYNIMFWTFAMFWSIDILQG
jgi:hypothetical protein